MASDSGGDIRDGYAFLDGEMGKTALTFRRLASAFLDGPALTVRAAPQARPSAMFGSLLDRWGKLTPYGSGDTLDTDKAYQFAMTSAWAASAIDLRAKALSGNDARPFMAQRAKDGNKPLDNHPFAALFDRPNSLMSGGFLLRYTSVWLDLRGNAYLFVSTPSVGRGEPMELWPLQADRVRPLPGTLREGVGVFRGRMVIDYEYSVAGVPEVLPGENVVHFRTPNPFDFWEGLSPLAAAMLGIELDQAQRVWQRDFFRDDNAIPSSIVSFPQETNEADFSALVAMIKDDLDNGRKRLFTRAGDLSVEVIAQTLEQMQIVESREFSRKEIDRVFGIPDGLMSGGLSGDSRLAAEIAFARHTSQPQLDYVAEQMSADIVPYYGDTDSLVIEAPNIIPQDRALEVQEYTIYSQERTVNENRAERNEKAWTPPAGLEELAPLADVPVRLLPMAQAKLMPSPSPAPITVPTHRDEEDAPDVGAMAGSPDPEAEMEQQSTRSIAWRAEAKQFRKWVRGKLPDVDITAFKATELSDSDKTALLAEMEGGSVRNFFTKTERLTPEELKALVLQLDSDDDEAEYQLRLNLERRSARSLHQAFRDLEETLFPEGRGEWENLDIALTRVRKQIEEDRRLRDAIARAVLESADLGVSLSIRGLERVSIGFDWTLALTDARDWASRYSGTLITQINATTLNHVQQATARWFQNGEGLEALIRDLEPTFGRRRAETIAATETTKAAAEGQLIGFRRSGVVEMVEWRTTESECPICGARKGKHAPLSGPTVDGLSIPAHVNCRCWWVPVID